MNVDSFVNSLDEVNENVLVPHGCDQKKPTLTLTLHPNDWICEFTTNLIDLSLTGMTVSVLDKSVSKNVLFHEIHCTQGVCFKSEYFELSVTLSCGTLVLVKESLHENWLGCCLWFRWIVFNGIGFSCTVISVCQWFLFTCIIKICALHFDCL